MAQSPMPVDEHAEAHIAKTMVSLYGLQAVPELRRLAMASLDSGDTEGFLSWQKILKAAKTVVKPTSHND